MLLAPSIANARDCVAEYAYAAAYVLIAYDANKRDCAEYVIYSSPCLTEADLNFHNSMYNLGIEYERCCCVGGGTCAC